MDTVAGVLYIEVGNIKQKGYEKSLQNNSVQGITSILCVNVFPQYRDRAIYIYIYIYDNSHIICKDSTMMIILVTVSECPL